MYKVLWKDADNIALDNIACERDVDSLDAAMRYAKQLNCLVTIKSNQIEIVGLFGADSVANGKCPDGVDYTWKKRRL